MKYTRPLSLVLGTTVYVAISTTASADICRDVVFRVTNDHFEERPIEIRSVQYRNPHKGGSTVTENVANQECDYGETCSTGGDNLADADKVDLTDFRVVFRHRNHDSTWSREFITQPFLPTYRKCKDDKVYGPIRVIDSPNSTVSIQLKSD